MDTHKTKKISVPFTQVANSVLQDNNLSLKAKGLFAYIYSKPDGWDFSYVRMAEEHKESKNTILSVIQELEKQGYLKRKRLSTGRIEYHLTFEPKPIPKSWARAEPLTQTPNLGHISNKDIPTNIDSNINNTSITYETKNEVPKVEVNDFFEKVTAGGEDFQIMVSKMAELTKLPPAMVASELKHFTIHWTERNKTGTKMRWEIEKTFEIRRRLVTWFNNKKTNFGRNKGGQNGTLEKYQVGSFSRNN